MMGQRFFGETAQAGVISDAPRITEALSNGVSFLLSLAGIVAILALLLVAIRFLFVRDNAVQAANAKRSLGFIILGLIVLFGAWVIIRQISTWFE